MTYSTKMFESVVNEQRSLSGGFTTGDYLEHLYANKANRVVVNMTSSNTTSNIKNSATLTDVQLNNLIDKEITFVNSNTGTVNYIRVKFNVTGLTTPATGFTLPVNDTYIEIYPQESATFLFLRGTDGSVGVVLVGKTSLV